MPAQIEEYGRVCDVLMSTYARPKFDPLRTLESTQHIPVVLLRIAHVLRSVGSSHTLDFMQRLLRLTLQVRPVSCAPPALSVHCQSRDCSKLVVLARFFAHPLSVRVTSVFMRHPPLVPFLVVTGRWSWRRSVCCWVVMVFPRGLLAPT